MTATKADIEAHFSTHGTGDIAEIKLMNGFGFIEYKDPMDARDVVPGKLPTPSPKVIVHSRKHHADVLRVLLAFRMFTITLPLTLVLLWLTTIMCKMVRPSLASA